MALTLTISFDNIVEAIKSASKEEKKNIVKIIENEFLSEWDNYDNSEKVIKKVEESISEYEKGEVVSLK